MLDTFCLSVSLWTVLDAMDGSQSLAAPRQMLSYTFKP